VWQKSAGLFKFFNSFLVFSQMPGRVQRNGDTKSTSLVKFLKLNYLCSQIASNSVEFLAVMALAESVSKTDTALDTNYAIMEDCNSPERTLCMCIKQFSLYVYSAPVDPCEMAAKRVKCVNDKDPNLLPDMIRHDDKHYNVC
jgi:hypothetical protein